MMNLRSSSDLFRAARKLAAACAFATAIAAAGAAQTNTFPSSGNAGIGTTTPNGGSLQVQSTTPDNHVYVSSTAPDVVFGNNATRSSATRIGFIGLATTGGHFFANSAAGDFTAGTAPGGGRFLLGTGGTTAFAIDTSQNIGIGTTNPVFDFHLKKSVGAGTVNATVENTDAGIPDSSAALNIVSKNSSSATQYTRSYLNLVSGHGAIGSVDDGDFASGIIFNTSSGQITPATQSFIVGTRPWTSSLEFHSDAFNHILVLKRNGNVGIGTTNPGNYRLNVSGPFAGMATFTSYIADGLYGATALPSRISTHNFNGGFLFGYEDLGLGDYSPRLGLQQTYDATGSPYITTTKASIGLVRNGNITIKGGASNTEFFRIDNSGNVGVGTTTPAYKLDVNGEINATGIRINGTPIPGGSSQWSGTGPIHYTGGNVGIGTTDVAHKLTVGGGWFAADNGYGLGAKDSGGVYRTVVYLDSANAIQIGNSSFTPNVVFNNSGTVGIGTTTPNSAYKLDVNGSINVSGNINAKYQDLAEWVPSSEQLSASTVVVLDSTKSNQVISSNVAYDTRVAGVISAQPGITLGQGGEGKVLVATTGRVRVKVDASRAAIQIGDLLVTSDIPGVAMKSEAVNLGGVQIHRPGTIVGKALEPLAKGKGEILVLLSLQ